MPQRRTFAASQANLRRCVLTRGADCETQPSGRQPELAQRWNEILVPVARTGQFEKCKTLHGLKRTPALQRNFGQAQVASVRTDAGRDAIWIVPLASTVVRREQLRLIMRLSFDQAHHVVAETRR